MDDEVNTSSETPSIYVEHTQSAVDVFMFMQFSANVYMSMYVDIHALTALFNKTTLKLDMKHLCMPRRGSAIDAVLKKPLCMGHTVVLVDVHTCVFHYK